MTDAERARDYLVPQLAVLGIASIAAREVLVEHLATARLEERRAIVAWLRSKGDRGDSVSAQAPVWTALRQAADRIERGAHKATP